MTAATLTGATGSVAALADTLFPSVDLSHALAADFASTSPLLVRMRWMHPASSLLALGAIVILGWMLPAHRRTLLLLLGAQFALGVLDVFWLAPLTLQVLHLFAADLLWVALMVSSSEVVWQPKALRAGKPQRQEHPLTQPA